MRPGLFFLVVVGVLLLVPVVGAQEAPPRHVDHDRAEASAEVLVATAQGMVDAGANGLETVLEEDPDREMAVEQAERSRELGGFLHEASQVETRNVTLEPLLDTLGPAGAEVGPAVANLTRDGFVLFHEQAEGVSYTLAWLNAREDLATARAHLAGVSQAGVDTERFEEALDRYEDRFTALNAPTEEGARLAPSSVFFGDKVRLTVFHPGHAGGQAAWSMFGQDLVVELDEDGVGSASVRVPWSAQAGVNEGQVAWPGGDEVPVEVLVERVPVSWQLARVQQGAWVSTLVDHEGEGVAGAPVAVYEYERRADVPRGVEGVVGEPVASVTTRGDGRAVHEVGEDVVGVAGVFEGNRTHEGAFVAWQAEVDPVPVTEEQGLADLFERVGVSEPPEAPQVAWLSVVLVVAGVLVVFALELEHAVWRGRWTLAGGISRRHAPVGGSSSGGSAVLDRGHPVVRALSAAGYDPDRLTFREAVEILEALGAPEVRSWARRHEASYYGRGEPAPVPGELAWWAEGMR